VHEALSGVIRQDRGPKLAKLSFPEFQFSVVTRKLPERFFNQGFGRKPREVSLASEGPLSLSRNTCVNAPASLHPISIVHEPGGTMRAEISTLVDDIKQSLGLLRRHL
jgi:hypothetical protein